MFSLTPDEPLFLSEQDWGGSFPSQYSPRKKGLAIDAYGKRLTGSTAPKFAPYDLELKIDSTNISYHDFKSSSTWNTITLSRNELYFAYDLYMTGQDLQYIIFRQDEARDQFHYRYSVRFSSVLNSIYQSQYNDSFYFFIN